jgi:hypothetical protein
MPRPKPSGLRVVKAETRFFQVLGSTTASPLFESRAEAEAWAARHEGKLPSNRQAKERACITCGTSFLSEGAHHRMCNGCRAMARDDTGTFGIMGSRGAGRKSNWRAGV